MAAGMNWRLLVIDDDSGLLALLSIGLAREGFEVITAKDGKEGLRLAYQHHPDIVLLDVLMEGMDGWMALQRLRQVTDVPVLILTAITDSGSVVKGLSLGADDFITKPCSFEVLKARIRSALRRREGTRFGDPDTAFDDGNLRIDLAEQTVIRKGELVHLAPTELRLLMYLVGHQGRIVPHKELLTNVWGPESVNETKYLSVYIRYLRQKVEDDPSDPDYIVTKHRVGYCFAGKAPVAPSQL